MAGSSGRGGVARGAREWIEFLGRGPDSDRLRMRAWAVLLLVPAAAFLLWGLDSRAIVAWDESRLAVNAIEMRRSGLSLVATYGFRPDLWNTKPPLVIWLMWASMQLFGPTEWAFRLPSALAAIGTLLLVYGFAWRLGRSVLVAGASVLILVCSFGFNGWHVAFTGDYDATLVFFVTAYAAALFFALRRRRPTWRAALAIGLLVGAAMLTKGIAGLIPGVGVLVFLALTRRLARPLDWRYVAGGVLGAGMIAGFYIAREAASPGYLAAMWGNEVGRYAHGVNGHQGPVWYYVRLAFWNGQFSAGLLALPLAAAAVWKGSPRVRFAALYCLCLGLTTLVVFSLADTKLRWYAAPSYPFLAVASALGLKAAARLLSTPALRATALTAVGAVLVVSAVASKAHFIGGMSDPASRPYGRVLDELGRRGVRSIAVLDTGLENFEGFADYTPQLRFYAVRAAERGETVERLDGWPRRRDLAAQVIASCDPAWVGALHGRGADMAAVPGCAAIRTEDALQVSPIAKLTRAPTER